jgi:hypothetical protein
MKNISIAAAIALTVLLSSGATVAQETGPLPKASNQKFDRRDFSGTWDRYPQSIDSRRDPTVVPLPTDAPPPPLKPQYQAAFAAETRKIAEANARKLVHDGAFMLFGSIEGGPSTAIAKVAIPKLPEYGEKELSLLGWAFGKAHAKAWPLFDALAVLHDPARERGSLALHLAKA